jgi:hypothetical protein
MLAKIKKEKQMQAEKDKENDLSDIPPDFNLAKDHAKSSMVFDLEKANEN